MRMWRRFTVTAGIGILALISAGYQASAQIKIGSVLSVTGPASFLGDPEKRTLEIYVDEINAKGGVNGQKPVSYTHLQKVPQGAVRPP